MQLPHSLGSVHSVEDCMLEASKQLLHGAPGRIRCARRTSLLPQATWAHAASLHHRLAARGHLEHTPIELQPTLYMRPLFYCFILSTVTSQPNNRARLIDKSTTRTPANQAPPAALQPTHTTIAMGLGQKIKGA